MFIVKCKKNSKFEKSLINHLKNMKNQVKPRYYNNVRNSISSPKTYRHGKESLSQVKTQKTSRVHKKYNLTSNSNKLQTKTSNIVRKHSKLEEAKSYEDPSSSRVQKKQTPNFLKLQKQGSQILDSKMSQCSYIGKSQTTRRESNISAFPPKLCEEFLLSQDKLNSHNQGSQSNLTPVLTQKKTNLKTFGVSSSSSLSMFNKMDLKIQSVNFNGSSLEDKHKNESAKFSYCEMKSSPTIKEIQFHGSNSYIGEYNQNKDYGQDFKLKRSPTKEFKNKKKPKNVKIFREYGSEIIGVAKKNEIKKAIGSKMMKTQEKVKNKLPRNFKGSEEIASISSMFDNTHRKDHKKRKTQKIKQVNK